MKKWRIGYARIAQETNALSPLLTEIEDFQRTHYETGTSLAQACLAHNHEAKGFLKNAELSGFVQYLNQYEHIELVPLVSAWAVPSGQLSKNCIQYLTNELSDAIKGTEPLDALYLCLHGAMRAEEQVDPDADLLAMVKKTLGEHTPVVASMDLHAVLTAYKVEQSDLIVAYKTNPHRDHKKVGQQCARLLRDLLHKKEDSADPLFRPYIAWRSLPMILGGGTTLDFLPPMRKIFKRAKEIEKDEAILSASIYMCQPWHDHPDLGWASYVASDGHQDKANQYADELADLLWQVRYIPPPKFTPIQQAIEKAKNSWLARKSGAVFLCDTSDVVTAGAPGNNTLIVQSLLHNAQGLRSYVAIRDPILVDSLQDTDVGSEVDVAVGGHLNPNLYPKIQLKGQLTFKGESQGFGQAVVIQQGSVYVCVTQASPGVMKADFYHQLGLNVWKADLVVVKNLFPWRLFCLAYNRKSIYVQTQGITDLDAARSLSFNRALCPFEEVAEWR